MKYFRISRGKIKSGENSVGAVILYSTKRIEYEEWVQIIEQTGKFGWAEDEWKSNARYSPKFVPKIQAITKYKISEAKLKKPNVFYMLQDSYSWHHNGIISVYIQTKKNMVLLFEVAKLFEAEAYNFDRKLVSPP